jgi:TIGR03009 family protein
MLTILRATVAGFVMILLSCLPTSGQSVPPVQQAAPGQQALVPQQPLAPQQPPHVQVPAGFQLNALEQARVNQVLSAWQLESKKINTFKCSFERLEYNLAFGPGKNIPQNVNQGELSYHRPDKGSFQIKEIKAFQQAQPGQPGQWVAQPNAIGEHWVCDGESIYEYRHNQKQLVERPIPQHLRGQAIADGPLPFLFGADAAKLQQRYWIRIQQEIQQENGNEIWLTARPKFQEQAADFTEVEVILDAQRLLPKAMQVHMPNGDRHVYKFDIANASVNSPLARLQALFERPRVPSGWKRIVEQMPLQQAAQPGAAAR